MNSALEDRFWSKVDKSGPCWLWLASTDGRGYGKINVGGKLVPAHRLSFIWSLGSIPDDKQLDHLCRNHRCVNPNHLEPVTQQVNPLRGETIVASHARKTACPLGHPYTKRRDRNARECRICKNDRRRAAYANQF